VRRCCMRRETRKSKKENEVSEKGVLIRGGGGGGGTCHCKVPLGVGVLALGGEERMNSDNKKRMKRVGPRRG